MQLSALYNYIPLFVHGCWSAGRDGQKESVPSATPEDSSGSVSMRRHGISSLGA